MLSPSSLHQYSTPTSYMVRKRNADSPCTFLVRERVTSTNLQCTNLFCSCKHPPAFPIASFFTTVVVFSYRVLYFLMFVLSCLFRRPYGHHPLRSATLVLFTHSSCVSPVPSSVFVLVFSRAGDERDCPDSIALPAVRGRHLPPLRPPPLLQLDHPVGGDRFGEK